jgi:hypothetical protein
MQITQDQLFAALRAVLVLIGTYLFGHNIFGSVIDSNIWLEITGVIMVVASFAWSWFSKSLTIEIVQSTILKVIMVTGGLLVTSGKISGDTLTNIVAAVTALLPIIYSFLSKKKSAGIITGNVSTEKLAK